MKPYVQILDELRELSAIQCQLSDSPSGNKLLCEKLVFTASSGHLSCKLQWIIFCQICDSTSGDLWNTL